MTRTDITIRLIKTVTSGRFLLLLVLVVCLLLSQGCATTQTGQDDGKPQQQVTNPNYSPDKFSQDAAWRVDLAACSKLNPENKPGQVQCLRNKGWPL